MRKTVRQKWLKTAIVALAFITIFGVTYNLNRLYIRKNTEMVDVVVAARKIPAYSLLSGDQLKMAKRPKAMVAPDAALDKEIFAAHKYYARDLGFGEGDIIRLERLSDANENDFTQLVSLEKNNQMLIAVNTNLVKSCANLVEPGTRVNAIVFMESKQLGVPDRIISPQEDPRLAHLLVVDKKNSEAAPPAGEGRNAIPAVVTLILGQEQMDVAKALVEYNEKGSVYLLPAGFQSELYLAVRE